MDNNETDMPVDDESMAADEVDQLQSTSGEFVSDAQGRLFFVDSGRPHVIRVKQGFSGAPSDFSGADTPGSQDGSRQQARFNTIKQLTINTVSNLMYIADAGNQRVRQFNLNTNQVTTLLTVNEARTVAGVNSFGARGVAADSANTLYISDNLNFVVWTYNANNRRLRVFAGTPGQRGTLDGTGAAARFNNPGNLVLNLPTGALNLLDQRPDGQFAVRQIAPDGTVKTIVKKSPTG